MLSKSSAKMFFLVGTGICTLTFALLTVDTFQRIPTQTNEKNLTDSVKRGKQLFDRSNCMGCHTILGEGAYYAPELTQVYLRRGPTFISTMLRNPEMLYPGQRRMMQYHFADGQIEDLVAFLKWIGEIDLNGFPPQPTLMPVALPNASTSPSATLANATNRPQIFNQLCIACHSLGGQGGNVGPALDTVGSRFDREYLSRWLTEPNNLRPGTKMPKLPLSQENIAELAAFLSQLKGESK